VSPPPHPGERWKDRYDIVEELGRGGFGRVYRAHDPRLDRDVAIKIIEPSDDLGDDDHDRFRRERRIAASLEHRNIVPVYDGGEHDGLLYLVMRFIDGVNLHNVLCQQDTDRVFLADFGISRPVDQTTEDRITTGLGPATFFYAAPEQLRAGRRIDGRTDVYALGCVLYECLTGARPFDGDIGAVINAHLHQAPPRVSAVRNDLDPRWDHVIARAMAKSPARRYQRCGELATAAEMLALDAGSDDDTTDAAAGGIPAAGARAEQHDATTPAPGVDPAGAGSPRTDATARLPGGGPPGHPPTGRGPAESARQQAAPPRARGSRARVAVDRPPTWRRAAVAVFALAVLGLATWFFWPSLAGDGDGDDNPRAAAAVASPSAGATPTATGALTATQRDLVDATGVFAASDCRTPTTAPFDGQQAAISCADDQQRPTRVVFRRFATDEQRDAGFAQLSANLSDVGDCRTAANAAHPWEGADGSGRVVCNTSTTVTGLTWTVPDDPVLGSSRIDDPGAEAALYRWWADLVQRRPGDRLPDCPRDAGLEDLGAAAAVQCRPDTGAATVVSHAQFGEVSTMDEWFSGVLDDVGRVRGFSLSAVDDPSGCAGLGQGDTRNDVGRTGWQAGGAGGRLLCFVNESDQNALFWTNAAMATGGVAVSPAAGDDATALIDLVDQWRGGGLRLPR
jgi:serine/threonine-protein kinase